MEFRLLGVIPQDPIRFVPWSWWWLKRLWARSQKL